jgi:hypothetical protein
MEIVDENRKHWPKIMESNLDRSIIKPQVLKSIEATVEEVADGKPIFLCGCQLSAAEFAKPEFLLPATLFWVCEALSSSAAKNSREIELAFDIKPDNYSVLMFKVSHVTPFPLRRLKSAIRKFLRQSERGDEFYLDDLLGRFSDFMQEILPSSDRLFENELFPSQWEKEKTFTIGFGNDAQ